MIDQRLYEQFRDIEDAREARLQLLHFFQHLVGNLGRLAFFDPAYRDANPVFFRI